MSFQPLTQTAWEAKWRWPEGTRVSVASKEGPVTGTVVKENPTTVRVRFDNPAWQATAGKRLIPMSLLTRL